MTVPLASPSTKLGVKLWDFGVKDLGLWVEDSGARVEDLGFRIQVVKLRGCLGFWVGKQKGPSYSQPNRDHKKS